MDDEKRLEELLQANFQEDIMQRQQQGNPAQASIQQGPQEANASSYQAPQQSNDDKVRQDHPFLSFFAENFPGLMEKLGRPLDKETKELSRYAKPVVDFAEDWLHLPELGAGILQTLTDVPISVANTALRPAGIPIPHADFRSMLKKEDSLGGDIAHGIGNLVGGVPAFGGLYGVADKLPRGAGYAANAMDALKGILTGYVGGEYNDEGEGRILSAAAGAPIGAVANLTNSSIGKNVGRAYKDVKNQYNKLYDNVWDVAKKEGLDTFNSIGNVSKRAYKGIDKKFVQPFQEAVADGQLKSLHKGRSKLLDYLRRQDKIVENGGAIDTVAYERAEKLIGKAEKAIERTLSRSKKGLGDLYNDVQSGYKKDVVPYSEIPGVRKHAAGKLTNSDFAKLLKGNSNTGKLFRTNLAGKHPDISTQKGLSAVSDAIPAKDILKYALGTALGGGILTGANKYYKGDQ